MKKTTSVSKSIQKGKSMSSIQQYQESRVTNKSIDTRKIDSKVSKVSKTHSMIKIHQPLSIDNKNSLKESKLQNTKTNQQQSSRRKIQSHLETKNSYTQNNAISFRQSENNKPITVYPRETQQNNVEEKQSTKIIGFRLQDENARLLKQNKQLKDKVYRMQETSLQDKEKIKTLITRISEIKRDNKCTQNSVTGMMSKSKTTASYAQIMKTRGLTQRENIQSSNFRNTEQSTPFRILQPSASQSKYSKAKQSCGNIQCEERRKYLEGQLYKERIKRDQLQDEKKEWQRNRDQLKRQYGDLLCEIQNLREESVCGEE